MELHKRLGDSEKHSVVNQSILEKLINQLRDYEDETELLRAASHIPQELVNYDSLAIVTIAKGGIGRGEHYSNSTNREKNHRLLDLVCRHKKIICANRSIQVSPGEGQNQNSFLSVPFNVLGLEAGSFNLLSIPGDSFTASQIQAIEEISAVVSRELERIRLRDRYFAENHSQGATSWKHFQLQANIALEETFRNKIPASLVKIEFRNIDDVEKHLGTHSTLVLLEKVTRLIEQVKRQHAIACRLYSNRILVLTAKSDVADFINRFRKLTQKISWSDLGLDGSNQQRNNCCLPGNMLLEGVIISSAHSPADGKTLSELCAKLNHWTTDINPNQENTEDNINARVWS